MSEQATKDAGQKAAEAEVEEDKDETSPFVVAADTTRMPMVFTNAEEADNPIIFVNDASLKLTQYDREEVLAKSFNFLLADDLDQSDLDEIAAAFAGKDDDAEIRYRHKDGSIFCASIFVNPVKDEEGKIVQHFVSLIDTTKHQRARDYAAMMIDELNHRVKNTLATVQSIVRQAVRNNSDPAIIRESVETRVAALSRAHDLLSREKWDGAGLHDLVEEALAPFSVTEGRAERYTIEGDNIRLSPKAVLALGIAFNELATNAVKYGAFSNEAGSISIKWTLDAKPDGRRLSLHWHEKDGPPVSTPKHKGFGSRVIVQGLAHELEGTIKLDYRPEGPVCAIDIPAPQAVLHG